MSTSQANKELTILCKVQSTHPWVLNKAVGNIPCSPMRWGCLPRDCCVKNTHNRYTFLTNILVFDRTRRNKISAAHSSTIMLFDAHKQNTLHKKHTIGAFGSWPRTMLLNIHMCAKKEHICSISQKMPSSQSAALIISFNHILISVNQHKSSRTKAVGDAVLHSSPLSQYRIPLKHCCTIRKDKHISHDQHNTARTQYGH